MHIGPDKPGKLAQRRHNCEYIGPIQCHIWDIHWANFPCMVCRGVFKHSRLSQFCGKCLRGYLLTFLCRISKNLSFILALIVR